MTQVASLEKKKKTKNIGLNFFYNVLFRIFSIIVPIISTPYLSSILGADGIGMQSYVASYSTYFVCAAMLGFGFYGQRLIAGSRNDPVQTSKNFVELYISQVTVGISILLAFIAFAFFQPFGSQYQACFFAEIITVASTLFDVNYYLEGKEEFGKITIRNVIVKVLALVAIFVFVKKSSDVWIYAVILATSFLISNLSIWPTILKSLVKFNKKEIRPFKHLPACFLLFLPTIAYKIYPIVDKTFIGLITKEDAQVGNYAKAQQIVDSCTTLVLAFGTVLSPRNSNLHATGQKEELIKNVSKGFRFVWFAAVPLCLGIVSIALNFVPWYLNDSKFTSASWIMMILSSTIIFSGMRNVFGAQFLIPTKQDKKYTIAVISGTLFNIGLSILLIFALKNYGAAIASVAAEFLICFIMFLFCKKHINLKLIFHGCWKYFLAGGIMFAVCFPLSLCLPKSIVYTFLIILVGAVIYFVLLFLMKEEFITSILSSLKIKLSKVISFFMSKTYEKVIFILFLVFTAITLLCYSPILLTFNANKYIFILWASLAIACIPFTIKNFYKIAVIIAFCWLPFLIYVASVSGYLDKDLLFASTTKEVFIACLLLFIGASLSPSINIKRLKLIMHVFVICMLLVGINIFIKYFQDFDITKRVYVYALKNSVAPMLLMAAVVPLLELPENPILAVVEVVASVFFGILIVLMKCRAIMIAAPFVIFYVLTMKKYKKYIKWIVIVSIAAAIILCFTVPALKTIVVDNILFAGRDGDNIDDISSGRLSLIIQAFELFKLSPFTGIGDYYVDLEPLHMMTIYGIAGYILSIPSFFVPAYALHKNRSYGLPILYFFGSAVIIFLSNSLFEAFSPYGPGIKTLVFWVLTGIIIMKNKEDFSIPTTEKIVCEWKEIRL